MKKLLAPAIGLLVASILPSYSLANPTDSISQNENLDEVVVVATRTPRALKNIPTITQVIGKAEIKRVNPRSVVDLLLTAIPGVQISRHGVQQRMRIQGLNADYMLFMIDGERITNEGNGAVDLDRIDPATIERIEIVRGASSALYGSSAIGGVINIITKKTNKDLEGSLRGYYSHGNMWRTNAMFGAKLKGFSSTTTGGYTSQQEYTIPDGEEETVVPSLSTYNIGQKFTYQNDENSFRAQINGTFSNRNQGFDDKISYLYNSYTAGGKVLYRPSDQYSIEASYHLEGYTRDKFFYKAKTDRIYPEFSFLGHTGRIQFNSEPEDEYLPTFNVGYETFAEGLRSDQFATTKRHHAVTNTLYAQSNWKIADWVTATLGLRQDVHSTYGAHLTPRAALLFREGSWGVRLSYSEGFRSPSLKQLYMDWDHRGMFFLKGNKDLRPETSRQFAIAPEFTYGGFNISTMLYANMINNRIIMEYRNNNRELHHINSPNLSRIYGVQTAIRWQVFTPLFLNLNYVYVYDYDPATGADGKTVNLSDTPPHSITGTISYNYRYKRYALTVDFSGRYFSNTTTHIKNVDTNNYEPLHIPGHSLFRIGVTQDWSRFVSLTLGIDNIFNYHMPKLTVNSPLSPGRNYFASILLRF